MRLVFPLLVAASTALDAASVKQANVVLRSGGCDQDAPAIVKLAEGTEVDVRSGVAGFSVPCYRVAVKMDGVEKIGYLPGPAIQGLDSFDRARQQAASGDDIQITTVQQVEAVREKAAKALSFSTTNPQLAKASKLIETNQPAEALAILEPILRQRPKDPGIYLLAGVAAWKNDDIKSTLEYWKQSLELHPDKDIDALYRKLAQENANDKSGEKAYGVRVLLRYERDSLDPSTASSIVRILDGELSRIQETLGCPSRERLIAIVQSPENFHGSKSAPQWSGGQYDGRIRVPFAKGQPVDGRLRQVLAHETTHACLANMGRWPTWLHEGLAQKLSGEQPDPQIQKSIRDGAAIVPGLENLGGGWTSMGNTQAQAAYTIAYMAAEVLTQIYPGATIQTILRDPAELPRVTAEVNRRLGFGRPARAGTTSSTTGAW